MHCWTVHFVSLADAVTLCTVQGPGTLVDDKTTVVPVDGPSVMSSTGQPRPANVTSSGAGTSSVSIAQTMT